MIYYLHSASYMQTEKTGARRQMKRVLLKLSGEALAGDKKTGFDEATCIGVAEQVKKIVDQGIQVAIVTGGGNFWRGRTSETIDRTKADQIVLRGVKDIMQRYR